MTKLKQERDQLRVALETEIQEGREAAEKLKNENSTLRKVLYLP